MLGLPLAFILSQDQTLHCIKCFVKSLAQISKVLFEITLFQEWKTLAAQLLQRTLFLYFYRTILVFRKVQISYLCPFTSPLFFSGKWCKGKYYFLNHQIFSKIFFKNFQNLSSFAPRLFPTSLRGATVRTIFETSKSFQDFFFSKPLRTCSLLLSRPRIAAVSLSKRVQR